MLEAGRTQVELAQLLGVTKSFISRVASGQRSLTLDHLNDLEQRTGRSIGLLLLDALPPAPTPEMQRQREEIRNLMRRPESDDDEDRPLTPAEVEEVNQLKAEVDQQIDSLMKSVGPRKRPRAVPKSRVLRLLQDEAGLTPGMARKVYEVQRRFAADQGVALFG